MKSFTTENLINNVTNKGIKFKSGEKNLFKFNDYYQIVNAYKWLFIKDVETIDDIIVNIDSNCNIDRYRRNFQISNYNNYDDLKSKICNRIIEKYDLNINKNSSISDKINRIRKMKYIHHIYKDNTFYGDFVRMYNFEHELRSLLLKNILIIEENIKRIFISVLNNNLVDSNFLVNIDNYNTIQSSNNKSMESLKQVISLYDNKKSKPIKRKRDENLSIPYWILINEMTMNQTIITIGNLKEDFRNKVFEACLNEFTRLNINLSCYVKGSALYNRDIEHIEKFKSILSYLGEFRNMLAHNQPIFNYNVKDFSLDSFPNISYILPKGKNINSINDQYNVNASLMHELKTYYGLDFYNRRNYHVNLDLSFIIYVMTKIIDKIKSDNTFSDDIRDIYKEYNILLSYSESYIEDYSNALELKKFSAYNDNLKLNYDKYISSIENGESYKRKLKSDINELNRYLDKIVTLSNKIKIKHKKSKYKPFQNSYEYKKYTNIDATYLLNL